MAEAMLSDDSDVDVAMDVEDEITEDQEKDIAFVVETFWREKCCKKECTRKIPFNVMLEHHMAMVEMEREEKDLVIIGQINAHRKRDGLDYPSKKKKKEQGKKKRKRQKYYFAGLKICRNMFCHLHAISKGTLNALCSHVDQNPNSCVPRSHGNAGKLPHNATPQEDVAKVRSFILNYAETYGQPLPGRMPGLKDTDCYYLPTDMSKNKVYLAYKKAVAGEQEKENKEAHKEKRKSKKLRVVGFSTFTRLWRQLCPFVRFLRPATDLCDECQFNSQALSRKHLSEEARAKLKAKVEAHMEAAKKERDYYNAQCRCTDENTTHLAFDYAQQIFFPHNPMQIGSAFFKACRKCSIFGIVNDKVPKDVDGNKDSDDYEEQVNYLIDESDSAGKGANSVVSMIHDYLEKYWEKTPILQFHADNCVGQNKNNTVIRYLMWYLLTSDTQEIEISFMVSGHTKFAPDRHFGLIKKLYNLSEVDTMEDIANLVRSSAINKPKYNQAELIRDQHTLEKNVTWYDWTTFLAEMFPNPIKDITMYHHFRMDINHPGIVRCAKTPDGEETRINIMNTLTINSTDRPKIIEPKGLSKTRQQYLHKEVSSLCSSKLAASITCPKPE